MRWIEEQGLRKGGPWGGLLKASIKVSERRSSEAESERLTTQLRSSPQVDQVLMIVESPDSLASRGLELESLLQLPHDSEVGGKDSGDHGLLILLTEGAGETKDEEVGEEGQLVARAIVQAS